MPILKKIKAFLYVAFKSMVSPAYYKEILKTPGQFSLKYYSVIVLIAATITTFGYCFTEFPTLTSSVKESLTKVGEAFPTDLEIKLTDGAWEINKDQPFIFPFPNNTKINGEKLPKNLVVFDKNGTLDDMEKYDTAFMVNGANFIAKQSGKTNVFPLKDFPNFTLNHDEFVKGLNNVSRLVWMIPAFLLVAVFSGLLIYYFLLRGLHVLVVGLMLFLVTLAAGKKLNFISSSRIALHSMTLPILIEVIVVSGRIDIPFDYWFLALNIVIAGAALWKVVFTNDKPTDETSSASM